MELLANRLCWRCPKRQSSNYPHVVTGRRVSRKCHIQTVAINTLINLHTKKDSLILPVSFSFAFMPHAKYAKFAHGIMHEQWSDFAPLPQKTSPLFEILSWAGNNGNHNLEWRCTQAYYHGEIKRIPIFQRHLEARDWPKVSAFLPGDKEVVILIVLRRVAVKLFDCASLAAPFEVLLY